MLLGKSFRAMIAKVFLLFGFQFQMYSFDIPIQNILITKDFVAMFALECLQLEMNVIYSKTPSNTAPSSTDLEVTLFRLDLKVFEQH